MTVGSVMSYLQLTGQGNYSRGYDNDIVAKI